MGCIVMGEHDRLDAIRYAEYAMRMIGDTVVSIDIMSGGDKAMNVNDINNALLFANSKPNAKYVVLQCNNARDIPYVKRALIQTLGEPRKMIDNSFYYGDLRVMIIPLSKDVQGLDSELVFYVSYKDNGDWNELCMNQGVKKKLVPYEMRPWLHEGDIYNLLIRDGIKPDEALHRMFIDGLIGKGI
jgi:hypothetical protein